VWRFGSPDLLDILVTGLTALGVIAATRAGAARFGWWRVAIATMVVSVTAGALVGKFSTHFGSLLLATGLIGLLLGLLGAPTRQAPHPS
jgi:hypothetical protein